MNALDFAAQHLSLSKQAISDQTGLTLAEIEHFNFNPMPWSCQLDLLQLLGSNEQDYDHWLLHGSSGEHIEDWRNLLKHWPHPSSVTVDDTIILALPFVVANIKKTGMHLPDIGQCHDRNGAFLHTYHFMTFMVLLLSAYQRFLRQYESSLSMLYPNPSDFTRDNKKMQRLIASLMPSTLLTIGEKGWNDMSLSSSDCLSQLAG